MNDLKMLYTCDHDVITRTINTINVSVVRGQSSPTVQMDKVSSYVPNIINATRITQYLNGTTVELSHEIYNYYDGYIIWTRTYSPTSTGKYRVPNSGESYNVDLVYYDASREVYPLNKCPRCSGTGWYLNPINESTDLVKVSGSMRVAQEFLKCLLTVRGTDSLHPDFGAGLLTSSGILYLDGDMKQYVESAVKNAETQCKSITESRPANEMLDKAIIEEITIDTDNSGVYVVIHLLTLDNTNVTFGVTI